MSTYHIPVLKEETVRLLDIKPNNWYLDCNLGGGGHTKAILESGANVIAIDTDPDAIANATIQLAEYLTTQRLILIHNNFSNLDQILDNLNIAPLGILYDLGVSTHQLNTDKRGFSFNSEGPLDMRMDPSSGIPASDLVNGLHEKELADLFWKLGEERRSRQISKSIVSARQLRPILTTNQLANIILSVRHRSSNDRTHPATRAFQALRIAVNDELNSLQSSLPAAFHHLKPHGRVVVISFHSLEDRIVKKYFAELVSSHQARAITKKPITPSSDEISANPRSRSGKLRAIEKL